MNTQDFKAGFVAFLGKPNAGKSTLLNRLLGVKLAAVSNLPQTTRDRFLGIYTDDKRQIVFVDLPGMTSANDKLNECLRKNVLASLSDADVVIHLVDCHDEKPLNDDMFEALKATKRPLILALNKIDGKRSNIDAASWIGEKFPKDLRERYTRVLGISGETGNGVDELLAEISTHLVAGPPMYDPDILTDRDMRYLAGEMIREKAFHYLRDELPYSTAVEIEEFIERPEGKWYIHATLYVERDSQKGMVVGKKGVMLRQISTSARKEIERICDAAIYLELFVKVRPKWRKRDSDLRMFGYK